MVNDEEYTFCVNSFFIKNETERLRYSVTVPVHREAYWESYVYLETLVDEPGKLVSGEDALQVLQLSFLWTRLFLEKQVDDYLFKGVEPLHCAFPKHVPPDYGLDVVKRIEAFIEKEARLWNEAVEARRKK